MDPETHRLIVGLFISQFIWMAKDMLFAARSQTQKNTEDIGALKLEAAMHKQDLNAAHSSIRELKTLVRKALP